MNRDIPRYKFGLVQMEPELRYLWIWRAAFAINFCPKRVNLTFKDASFNRWSITWYGKFESNNWLIQDILIALINYRLNLIHAAVFSYPVCL